MGLIHLPTELILLILPPLSESDLAHLLRVHWSLYDIILPYLYRRHLQGSRDSTGNGRNEAKGFFRCIVTSNTAGVQRFLDFGADVNAVISAAEIRKANFRSTGFIPWHDTQTPLNIAASMGDDTLVSLLLNHGASVTGSRNHQDARRAVQPAAVDALLSNHESTLRLLLRRASPLSAPNMERGGLLNCAIARGNLPLLRMLVNEFGADLNATWQEGVYPLNRAVVSSGPEAAEIVRFMLDKGADAALANGGSSNSNGDEESTGGGSQRLLDQAIRHGTIDTLRLILGRGVVDPAIQPLDTGNNIFRTWIIERCTPETVHLLHEHGYFRALDSSQDDTLMIAVRARRGDILQLFINSGVVVDLNARLTRGGSTLLHAAVVRCKPVREAQAASSIRCTTMPSPVASSDVPTVRKIEPEYSREVLSRRCMSEKVEKCAPEEIVRCLVRGGADVNTKDARGISPLDLAEKGPEVVYRILVDSRCE
ncbi:Hypothetical protein PENO1_053400 [Penicillium occitanis (nom. inval.)]|nr:Hypothetical protein PENO1_053400 [Penicillium occitanis (nom. inval.)]PCH04914.1 hypothetical protein PENOC_031410 [Penicillium occitanis (nom. inval.)]